MAFLGFPPDQFRKHERYGVLHHYSGTNVSK